MKYKNRAIYQNDAVKTNRDEKNLALSIVLFVGRKELT